MPNLRFRKSMKCRRRMKSDGYLACRVCRKHGSSTHTTQASDRPSQAVRGDSGCRSINLKALGAESASGDAASCFGRLRRCSRTQDMICRAARNQIGREFVEWRFVPWHLPQGASLLPGIFRLRHELAQNKFLCNVGHHPPKVVFVSLPKFARGDNRRVQR
jgi:hypothetical protein